MNMREWKENLVEIDDLHIYFNNTKLGSIQTIKKNYIANFNLYITQTLTSIILRIEDDYRQNYPIIANNLVN